VLRTDIEKGFPTQSCPVLQGHSCSLHAISNKKPKSARLVSVPSWTGITNMRSIWARFNITLNLFQAGLVIRAVKVGEIRGLSPSTHRTAPSIETNDAPPGTRKLIDTVMSYLCPISQCCRSRLRASQRASHAIHTALAFRTILQNSKFGQHNFGVVRHGYFSGYMNRVLPECRPCDRVDYPSSIASHKAVDYPRETTTPPIHTGPTSATPDPTGSQSA